LIPFGGINLDLPDWEHDLYLCLHKHKMRGVRLYPGYHGYTLADPRFVSLVKQVAEAGRVVQIASTLEDTRTQHPMVRVADVNLSPLPDTLRGIDGAVVQILNSRPSGKLLERLSETPGLYFDTARLEGTDAVARLLQTLPTDRLMFGSHAPFLIPEAALMRTLESQLEDQTLRSVLCGNSVNL
jgi:predicted TIM-barrel fold metal-dependent hydrolase